MDKKQREARRRQEDKALNRALLWVAGAVVLEILLLLVNRYYINFQVSEVDRAIFVRGALIFVRLCGGVCCAAAAVWAVLRFQKGGKFALPTVLALALGALAVCAHVALSFQGAGVQMLFLLVPAWAGLALIYYLYHQEFFLSATALGMSALGLWFVRCGAMLEPALLLVGIAAVAAASLWLKRHDGTIQRAGGESLRVMSTRTSYRLLLVNCLGAAVALAAAMVIGRTAAYYLIFVMIAWLFALLVYYTVKLM